MRDVRIITKDQIKTYLNTTSTGMDDLIDTYLPVVDSDVKLITCHHWRMDIEADTTTSTGIIADVSFCKRRSSYEDLYVGAVVKGTSGTEIDDDTTVTNWTSYDEFIVLSSTPNSVAENIDVSISTFPAGKKPVVAKMVLHRILSDTTSAALKKEVVSRSLGPSSVTLTENSSNTVSGYPANLVESLREIIFASVL